MSEREHVALCSMVDAPHVFVLTQDDLWTPTYFRDMQRTAADALQKHPSATFVPLYTDELGVANEALDQVTTQ